MKPQRYSRQELINGLLKVREKGGEPLSGMVYQALAPELGLPAYNTIIRHFGSWQKALEAAGVRGNPPRGRKANAITPEQCIEAVARCIREHGGRVSYETYRRWAVERNGDVPSGPSVRLIVPGWNHAVDRALSMI